MYVKIIFIILIIIILCYIINNYILLSNDITQLYDKFNRLNDDHLKLVKIMNNNANNNTKIYDCSKIFKESDDSECYVNQQTDLDKSVICYQSKSGELQLVPQEQPLTAINETPTKDDDKSSLALPLGSFVDAFLKKCLYNDDQDHIYYPEQKNDTECITDQIILNESDHKKSEVDQNQNNVSSMFQHGIIKIPTEEDVTLSTPTEYKQNNDPVNSTANYNIIKSILEDDKYRKKKINNIIESVENFKSFDNLKLINNI